MAGKPSTKGSWQRPGDKKKFDDEFDRIFGVKNDNRPAKTDNSNK